MDTTLPDALKEVIVTLPVSQQKSRSVVGSGDVKSKARLLSSLYCTLSGAEIYIREESEKVGDLYL
jgi:hypothetical protein